jgi:hypothetical protein
VFSWQAPDRDGPVGAELDRFASFVNESSVTGRSVEGRNSGTAGPDSFSQTTLRSDRKFKKHMFDKRKKTMWCIGGLLNVNTVNVIRQLI